MAETHTYAVYSQSTGRLRRVVVSDELSFEKLEVRPGEAKALVAKGVTTIPGVQVEVDRETGKEPVGDRYALIDAKGAVFGAVIADPTCGDDPSHVGAERWEPHEEAGPGWTHDGKEFIPPEQPIPDYEKIIADLEARKARAKPGEIAQLDEFLASVAAAQKARPA